MTPPISRRTLLLGGLGVGAAAGGVAVGVASGVLPGSSRLKRLTADEGPAGVIPAVPKGKITLEKVASTARARTVGLFTAVPDGHGDGKGLPVCLILHGASATTADYDRFGLAQFLTAAVRDGVPPFVLVGADGGQTFWDGGAGDDPQAMLADEMPRWCTDRGFDASRIAVYGWSMGGYGSLRYAELHQAKVRAVAALSPAVRAGDDVFANATKLDGSRTALWCGDSDPLFPAVQQLATKVPVGPAIADWQKGAHTRDFWNRVTPAAFAFVGAGLARA